MAVSKADERMQEIVAEINKVEDKLVISEPKTKSSQRTIVLSAPVLKMLRQYKESAKSEWLFPSPINPDLPREPSACRKKLTQILEHANCKHVRFHDLRHTFATMAIENGIDIKTVAALLGHNTVATSLNTYTHTTELECEDKLAELIKSIREGREQNIG